MELYPSWLRKLWKEWDLRVTVLFSLTLQIFLIFLGNRRKYSNKLWIRIVVWSAYITADSIATFALGILSNNLIELYDKDHDGAGSSSSLDANTQLSAFWASFLVLHLGGPDTITAYALEDNELWLRHLIGLVVQTGMALSVFLMSWTAYSLSILSLVMFLPGIIKYAERTWVLRLATSQKRRESNRSYFFPVNGPYPGINSEEDALRFAEEDALRFAEETLNISKHAFLDDTIPNRRYTLDTFRILLPEYALKVIEIQVGMMYDLLYTKAPLLYTCWGLVLRLISFVLTCSVMVLFPVLVDKHTYSKVDLSITYLLIIAAVIHDIYAALLLVLSDTFAVWLIEHRNDSILTKTLNCFPLQIFKWSCSSKKRWSNNMSQYTLVSVTANKAKTEMQTSKFLDTTRVMGNYWHCEVSDDLRKLIFMYAKEKGEDAETNRRNMQWRPPFTEFYSTIGIREKQPMTGYKNINEEFECSIIIWHIATEIWYYSDRYDYKQNDFRLKCKMIKRVSRYMMYLLVERPSMLSAENSEPINFRDIRKEVEQGILSRSRSRENSEPIDRFDKKFKAEACKSLLEKSQYSEFSKHGHLIKYAVELVYVVNDQSQSLESKWKGIENQWMDLLGYAARKCIGNEHAQQLRRGGELLTHVWLLLFHFQLTDHYPIDSDEEE
ncbi:hypothetical protein Dsin_014355 [Dipteronia sinensis]|uniref:DUF4220 domain-containing protein n=1 Tax=Dipteronia sinensis TaxID=43782 RepID=A0AAE0AMC9_9ROSI|nr:hypothetical protein Dsin_014355 [Dipteronia sinensis]